MDIRTLLCPVFLAAILPCAAEDLVLEDFTDIVTRQDAGLNDFSGNMGVINKWDEPYGSVEPACPSSGSCPLRFKWNFTITKDSVAYTGFFFSLFGLSDARVTFDGRHVESVHFNEHCLDLDNVDGALAEPGGPRRVATLCVELSYRGAEPLCLRMELKDARGGIRYGRFPLAASDRPQRICWNFRSEKEYQVLGEDADPRQAKILSCVIEREHTGDGVRNPDKGSLVLQKVWLATDRPRAVVRTDDELLDLVERRTCQYFLDWSSRKPASSCLPQDRSTFGDLLTVGGLGFGLPAYAIAAERGWLPREAAARRAVAALRILDNPASFGPEASGRIGHRGWFYHYLGLNGKRRLNFDEPATPADESLNTVEVSTIDTGLALFGALVAQSYFDGDAAVEKEIRRRAQSIYDRVDWKFMLDPERRQFYLGWKPDEKRAGAPFAVRDGDLKGGFSGAADRPGTLDYYTDEALIVALLALGSKDASVPKTAWGAWNSRPDAQGLVRSYPGSLFTYQFLHAFLDTKSLPEFGTDGGSSVDWYENSRLAMQMAVAHALCNVKGYRTYGPAAWGLSAAEGPFDRYRAYGIRSASVDPSPVEDGTVSYYSMVSAISFGPDFKQMALSAIRQAGARGHWHGRFGLPDAFNDEIAQAASGSRQNALRSSGPWVQRALFAVDQGPMLLHIENARSGLVWNLVNKNPNIQRALKRIRGGEIRLARNYSGPTTPVTTRSPTF